MILHLLLSLILSIEVIVLTDFIMVLKGIHFKLSLYGMSMLLLFALFAFVVNASDGIMFAAIMTILMIPYLMYLLWLPFAKSSHDFEDVDNGKAECYGNKKVLLIVPHQDDELNVLGGVFEEYLKYGSTIYVVYVMGGIINAYRCVEGLNFCKRVGIPSSNVTFLGYGFILGRKYAVPSTTKGAPGIPAYREGQPCKRENLVNDLKEIILQYKPDIIYGSDYDYQSAHHLVTIAIDEAVGKVLRGQPCYRPIVLKSYAYRTTWESYPDYYGNNIRSTRYKKAEMEIYPWEERLRLPIAAHMLNRSLLRSEIFQQYKVFKSQEAVMRAINFNADKVVWHRRSDSLLLHAKVEVSSGEGSWLNDFLLYDKTDVLDRDILPVEGAWIPDETDKERKALFILKQPSDIEYLLLHQNPVVDNNIVERVAVSFNGETPLEYSLRTDGFPTRINANKFAVVSIEVRIVNSKGGNAGLTEIEAFEKQVSQPFSLVKLMNESGDFIYDYLINISGEETLSLYAIGMAKGLSNDEYSVSVSNPRCKAYFTGSQIRVYCPTNESTLLRVESTDLRYSDTVMIFNIGKVKRNICTLGQKMEAIYYDLFIGDMHRKATTLSILSMLALMIRKAKTL